MKGICHIWSWGRHFSPSMPGDRYLKLGSPKGSPGRNLGEHRSVRRSGTASRSTVLLGFCLRVRRLPRTEVLTIFVGKDIRVGSTKQSTVQQCALLCEFLRNVDKGFGSMRTCLLCLMLLRPLSAFGPLKLTPEVVHFAKLKNG